MLEIVYLECVASVHYFAGLAFSITLSKKFDRNHFVIIDSKSDLGLTSTSITFKQQVHELCTKL